MTATIFSGTDDLIVILVALIVIFGGSQLPKLAKNTGEALREFRRAHSPADEAQAGSPATAPSTTTSTPAAAVVPTAERPAQPAQLAAPPSSADEVVTLTRAQLAALLSEDGKERNGETVAG